MKAAKKRTTQTTFLMTSHKGKGEFGRIQDFFAPLTEGHEGSFGLLDDAALLDVPQGYRLVVTTDMLVRGVHFLGDEPPEAIAAKALRVNLSDLAAKGAKPFAYSLALALPSDIDDDWVARLAQGLSSDQKQYGLRLLGGDSVSTPGPVTISITAFGTAPVDCYPNRARGRSGDLIFVSGTIGDSALGLLAARGAFGGVSSCEVLVQRYRYPDTRIELGLALRGYVNAAMDISDGLVGDLSALAMASGCSAEISSTQIPLSDSAATLIAADPNLFETALTGGDDYELLVTISPDFADAAMKAASKAGVEFHCIGRLSHEGVVGQVCVRDIDGNCLEFSQEKYTHA